MKDHNTLGRYYETLFISECLKRGITVLSPVCSHLPFDLVVLRHNRFLRIQVKGTSFLQEKYRGRKGTDRYYRIPTKDHRGKSYALHDVDYVVGYIEPKSDWYMISQIEMGANFFHVNPNESTACGRAVACKNRWDLFM